MRCLSSIIAAFFSFVTVLPTVRALPQSIPYVLKRDSLNATHRELTLEKRFNNGRFSFYDAGLGACGKTNTGSDFIVALNAAQWDGGSHCFQTITISYQGKSTQAQITDLCPGCPYGGLDLTRGLFSYFADQSVGIIYGTWNFGNSNTPAQADVVATTITTPAPTTTTTQTPTPTPAYTPTTTPTPTPTPTPTSTTTPATSSSSPAVPAAAPANAISADVISQLNGVIVELGSIVAAAASLGQDATN
ncbi:hypothetical protein K443DRAFT_103189 [Laccaria amethystina LaAM-08-1]|uniref:RlpA-like protein double-psi beta-barrel domain-containing protein n=1 Tax=Laccaria amethystina LaAM-08-1 TaxID=1095629 RepID=A0A0C9XBT1_9AGAR|nr:hypothetical protein K443DRAFT_103189 [Laccaria amethystina LaAM-08-1]